ncbi:uncharacterized protein LOC110698395 [Chenopodium quinoa]|uniref:uncharacterized protein LOC110698395 n=1 Tax=Chenopodium quinoa TaxID=63459 RepID=UPI000B76BBFF|nr:uncharacterized protein LOC110698395 [Chenopodium quinoa]
MCLVGEFEEANASADGVLQEQHLSSKWKAPAASLYKLNTDAAFQGQRLGIGGILRDEEGAAVVVYCSTENGRVNVAVGEAFAIRASLKTAMAAGFRNFILETDNIRLFHHLKKSFISPCYFGNLVKDILILASSCQSCDFSFGRKSGNFVAHSLAKLSFSFSDYRVWLEEYPPKYQGALRNDIESLVI